MGSERVENAVGCLVIDGLLPGEERLSGLSQFLGERGVRAEDFRWDGMPGLHRALQLAYQRVRIPREMGISGIAASGMGCAAALALAVQLPVDRLLLVPGDDRRMLTDLRVGLHRELHRLVAFARTNAAFCVADVLLLGTSDSLTPRRFDAARRLFCSSRLCGAAVNDLWANGKNQIKWTAFRFLCDGVSIKSLAENPEMCIIYG